MKVRCWPRLCGNALGTTVCRILALPVVWWASLAIP